MSAKRRSKLKDILGISYSTAYHQLNKVIIFNLAQQLGLSICFRCDEPIDSAKDFSIEHKQYWQDSENPLETFLDFRNVAFSHSLCNSMSKNIQYQHGKFRGVSLRHEKYKSRLYAARIGYNQRTINIGNFDTPEEAAEAYDVVAQKLFGSQAVTNESLGILVHRNAVQVDICSDTLKMLKCVSKQQQSSTRTFSPPKDAKTCSLCNIDIRDKKKSGLCWKCATKSRRVTARPSKEVLENQIKEFGYKAVGRMYGVSDNAIRKWLKVTF